MANKFITLIQWWDFNDGTLGSQPTTINLDHVRELGPSYFKEAKTCLIFVDGTKMYVGETKEEINEMCVK